MSWGKKRKERGGIPSQNDGINRGGLLLSQPGHVKLIKDRSKEGIAWGDYLQSETPLWKKENRKRSFTRKDPIMPPTYTEVQESISC